MKPPLTWQRFHLYERNAKFHLQKANGSKDGLEKGFHLDEARRYARLMGRSVERVPAK